MEDYKTEMDRIKKDLEAGKTIEPTTIRDFISWFDMYRRTKWNRDFIDKQLDERGLTTVPNYKKEWVDLPMTFALKVRAVSGLLSTRTDEAILDASAAAASVLENRFGEDPSFKIGKLDAACRPPLWAAPTASLLEITTKMFANDFSQIPIMQNKFNLKGIVSWKSIGLRTSHGCVGSIAQDFMVPAREVLESTSIFDSIESIISNDYVLVRNSANEIAGIVTAADLCEEFERISKPFLLISEIEINIRSLIENSLDAVDLEEFFQKSSIDHVVRSEKLTFGDYIMILQNEENWKKVGLKLDRKTFCDELEKVRNIRNDIMHFAAEKTSKGDLNKVKTISQMLDTLRSIARDMPADGS